MSNLAGGGLLTTSNVIMTSLGLEGLPECKN
jgi:hypothetical protein